jgi:N-acetylglucosamine malate deacetylase 1
LIFKKNLMNPYRKFVDSFAGLYSSGKSLPLGGIPPSPKAELPVDAPVVLIFSPHPDDECIIGGLPFRWLREAGIRVVNVAVTLGSKEERQQPRLQELKNACDWLGFGLQETAPNGLEKISLHARNVDPSSWLEKVKMVGGILSQYLPRAIFLPHESDWNSTHIGTHFLVMDALKAMPASFRCLVVETEFWGMMHSPNLMIESKPDDVADLLAALSFHAGEVQRNPYHLRLPAWLQDNVRRGAELVGGQGGESPDFVFATLYRLRQWKNSGIENIYSGGRLVSAAENSGAIFNWQSSL